MPKKPPVFCPPKIDGPKFGHYDDRRGSSTKRGYGRTWQALRKMILRDEPLCRHCQAAANEVDHIIPKARGGTDARGNLQSLCKPCHSRKTATEDSGFAKRFGP